MTWKEYQEDKAALEQLKAAGDVAGLAKVARRMLLSIARDAEAGIR